MNGAVKMLALIFVILYVVSPADAVPGPIDDMMIMMLYYMTNKRIEEN